MQFSQLKPKDIFVNNFIDKYNKDVLLLYSELVTLNANIYILEHIQKFPFNLFCNPSDTVFFKLVQQNFYNTSILTITKVATDKGKDLITLPSFKNKVIQNLLPRYQNEFKKILKTKRFNEKVSEMLEDAKNIRNSQVAHLKEGEFENTDIKALDISQLKHLKQELNGLLQILSFNFERIYLPLFYTEFYRKKTDLEHILDSFAKKSKNLYLPEQSPQIWERFKMKLSKEKLDLFNFYRDKFNLSQV